MLCPLLDIFNHTHGAEVEWRFSESALALVLPVSAEPYGEGWAGFRWSQVGQTQYSSRTSEGSCDIAWKGGSHTEADCSWAPHVPGQRALEIFCLVSIVWRSRQMPNTK